VDGGWAQTILNTLARTAGEHPVLIGALLLLIITSTALHALLLAGHVFLAFSRVLRRQVSDVKDLGGRLGVEWEAWRQETIDIFRFRSMTEEELDMELRSHDINAERTSQIVAAFAESWLRRQAERRREKEPVEDESTPSSGTGSKKHRS